MDTNKKESIFENKFHAAQKDIVREYIRIWFGKLPLILAIFGSIIFCIGVGFIIRNIIIQDTYSLLPYIFAALLGVGSPIIVQIRKYRAAKQLLKEFEIIASAKIKKEDTDYKTVFYSDTFQVNALEFSYSRISKVLTGKLCVYLVIEKTVTVIVKKEAFTRGECKNFLPFILKRTKIA